MGIFSKISSSKSFNKILKMASMALIIKVFSGVLTFLMFLVVARVLTAEQFGLFGVGFSLALFSSVVGSLGLGTLIMRLWPEYMVTGKHEMAVQALVWAIKKTFFVSLIPAGLIFVIFIIFDITKFKDHYDFKFGFSIAVLTISMSISEFVSAALRAQRKLTLALAPKDVFWRLFVILVFGSIYSFGIPVDAGEVLLGSAVLLILVTVFQIILSDLKDILNGNQSATSEYRGEWLGLAKPIWLGAIIFSSTMHADMMLVSFFLDAETIAAYFAALKIASVLALPMLAINQLSGPMISKHFHSGDVSTLEQNLRLYLVFCTAIVLPMLFIIIFYGRFLLALFNPVFADAYFVLVALSVGYLFHCLSGPAGVLLQMTGRSILALKTSSATQVIALLLFPFAVTTLGSFGIALTRMFEMALRNSLQSFQGCRIFGIHTSIASFFFKKTIVKN
jgi:O-antigen/teichoic acid export membrane protein